MKNLKKLSFTFLLAFVIAFVSYGEQPLKSKSTKSGNTVKSATAGCIPPSAMTELDLNNVRTLIMTGGDMWWDGNGDPRYEVPKGSGKNSLFAGAIWVGGVDINGQLRLAAIKYRTNGYDFWPGPLITEGEGIASVTPDVCVAYDKHFVITRQQVAKFRAWSNADANTRANDFPNYSIPDVILNWPGNGDMANGYAQYLAPFWDVNGDGFYNPREGDYPYYDLDGKEKCGTSVEDRVVRLFGDKTLWWVYNDKGNIHTHTTGAAAIGMEFRAQAFAFSTNDELNNMTFYNYEIINRSTFTLTDTYFGVWTDADLGDPYDDYVGCDVNKGLGYLYNGEATDGDGNGNTYGKNPPAIGIDFFEGPYQDPDGLDNLRNWDANNNLDCSNGYGKEYDADDAPIVLRGASDIFNGNINGLNFGDARVDNERWGMRRYLYFNNGGADATSDPVTALDHYNYLKGIWKDGNVMQYGGTGYKSGGPSANFMFPNDTDPCGWGTSGIPQPSAWSEQNEGNTPGDRRFVQSAGPFILEPGAVNDITLGAVWARAQSGTPFSSVIQVQRADDKAQRLFENCFKVIDGPDAPDVSVIELDGKIIFQISNNPNSNNYLEQYADRDPFIICPTDPDNPDVILDCDVNYRFQGYQVFQLKDATVSITDIHSPDLARLIFQCDIKDGVSQLVNYEWDDVLGANIPVEEVNGANDGIVHTFTVTDDYFASSSRQLVNYKKYYYVAIAYAYNDFLHYDQNDPLTINGQKKPYLASRKGAEGAIQVQEVIPHPVNSLQGGTTIQSDYGDGPKIVQIEGKGNAYNELELTQESLDKIMSGSPWKDPSPTYMNGHGPVTVKVIDPLNVPDADFILAFSPDSSLIKPNHYSNSDSANINLYGLILDTKWMLLKRDNESNTFDDTVFSESWIRYQNEQLIPEWGISVSIDQVQFPGGKSQYFQLDNGNFLVSKKNGIISSSMEYENPGSPWLDFFPDIDGSSPLNWIRSGSQTGSGVEDYGGKDPDAYYEKIIDGRWAPYAVASSDKYGPVWKSANPASAINFKDYRLSSIDLVITSDKDKWTRCPVIEMAENSVLSEGHAAKFDLRSAPSVDKDGNPDNSGTHGMSWFPGYAIDIATGERLNMMFGEDSWLLGQNGRDMMFNPTADLNDLLFFLTGGNSGFPLLGGKHYIYVMGHNEKIRVNSSGVNDTSIYMPAYDEGKYIYKSLTSGVSLDKVHVWQNPMWCAIPYTNPNFDFLSSDITIKIRTAQPYSKNLFGFAKSDNENNNYPLYSFDLSDIAAITNNTEELKNSLDDINIVPNPYKGYSEYEGSQLENLVKITNLPQKCTISIYTINGTLVRRFKKDNNISYVDWDLKNSYGISIASGVYIIYIDADGIGEKILKWFGSLRPIDLNAF
ncbi:MAG: T9SS type A sorting domain-containing protein [Chlorobi bacterium]|nr:T9SS type A sorting domain-containing protein [Chlorobiota bacterium]